MGTSRDDDDGRRGAAKDVTGDDVDCLFLLLRPHSGLAAAEDSRPSPCSRGQFPWYDDDRRRVVSTRGERDERRCRRLPFGRSKGPVGATSWADDGWPWNLKSSTAWVEAMRRCWGSRAGSVPSLATFRDLIVKRDFSYRCLLLPFGV